ncbi:hypothetical protein HU200_004087 [Digitaria exilis]|uniref:Uncharacterized protein n=1 Tax=Digitaria exilis TaxID=1010633 RepID=A0A835FVJ7_9POAL|nr:hypothetical protein HU200_004087 [Digitaria exilis]CAB3447874.1 unnamed protein product [Digitaria exilis]
MALLAIQGMTLSTGATALASHHHGAVSSVVSTSSYALTASAAFPRARATLAVGATTSAVVTPVLDVYCGRGDKKTKRGKRFNHSYGNARPRNKKKGTGPPRLFAPPAPPRKDQFDDGEIIPIEIDEDILE